METTSAEEATTLEELKQNPLQKLIRNHHKVSRKKNMKSKKKEKKKSVFSCDICNKQFATRDFLQRHKRIHSTSHSYSCDKCDFTSRVSGYLTRHVKRMHGGTRSHVCGICGNKYLWRSKLMHHMLVHTGEKPFKCDVCGKAFNTTYSLNTHKLIHTNEKPFKCSYCEYACRDSSTLRKHQARHTGQQRLYKCKVCSKTVKNKWDLKNHIAEEHLQLDIRKHQCDACDRRFKVKTHLSRHIKSVHEKSTRATCEVCGARVSTRGNLHVHMLTHVDARPYKCTFDDCGKTYKDNTSLRRHSIIHYPEQQHLCEICNRTFSREIRLKRHLLQHMPRAKTLECHHCGARFFNKSYLSKHIRCKHTGKRRRYVCDECGFQTHNKPSVVMHIKYGHVSESDRMCKKCNKTFKRNVYLKLHYIRKHGIRYKTKQRKPKVEIKEEPEEFDDRQSIDLFEIEKHELLDDLNLQLPEAESDAAVTTQKSLEDAAIDIIKDNSKHLNRVPDTIFNDLYIDSIVDIQNDGEIEDKKIGRKNKFYIDRATQEQAKQSVRLLLAGARRKEEARTLERTRQQNNERMRVAVGGVCKKEKIKLKYFNNNQPNKKGIKKKDSIKAKLNDKKLKDVKNLSKNVTSDSFNDRTSNQINKNNDNDCSQNMSLNDKQADGRENDEELKTKKNEANVEPSNKKIELEVNKHRPKSNRDSYKDKLLNEQQSSNSEEGREVNKNVANDDLSEDKPLKDGESDGCDRKELKVVANDAKDINDDKKGSHSEELEVKKDGDSDSLQRESLDNKQYIEEKISRKKQIRKSIKTKRCKAIKNKANDKNDDSSDNESFNDKRSTGDNDSDWKEEELTKKKISKKSNKIIFNTHQCYTCFKLYETKEKLLEHCKDHFDICSNVCLKKCPLCEYVSKTGLPRHMLLRHGIKMKVPYGHMKDKKHNDNGSRYYFEVNNPEFSKIEVIPSVRNLNKIACTEIDRRNREMKANVVAKTKLVKKGNEWVVITEKVKVNAEDFILPELVTEEDKPDGKKVAAEKNDTYLDRMKRLSVLAKKNGKKMMFPCEKCDKICLNLAALKLHSRKHDPNAKPFKPKVWKHKQKGKLTETPEVTEKKEVAENFSEANRKAKPKPIVNKHKCDPELKKFYENNIRGKNIEFWQFLKIFNKMDRENVKDFGDLENRIDFGIHPITETEKQSVVTENHNVVTENRSAVTENRSVVTENGNINSLTEKPEKLTKVTKKISAKVTNRKVNTKKDVYKRVIRISKTDHMRRNAIKTKLRHKLANQCT